MTGGIALGSVMSGVLLQHFWWGSVFLVNLPAMVLLLVLGPVLLPESKDPAPGRFDLLSVAAVDGRRPAGGLRHQGDRRPRAGASAYVVSIAVGLVFARALRPPPAHRVPTR